MAKLKNPMLSLGAVGRLAKHLSLTRRRRQNIIETTPIPKDAKSLSQLSWRHMYQKAVALWHALSAAEKQEWESLARPKHMTGFAWFISQALKPNPGIYLPLQGGTMAGDIDMAKNRLLRLPLPTDDQEAASKKYHDDNLPAGGYTEGARVYHNLDVSIPHATSTSLPFNSERYDTDTIHDTVVNNHLLTCKTAGKYLIIAQVKWEKDPISRRDVGIKMNNVFWIAYDRMQSTANFAIYSHCSTIFNLIVGDFLVVWVTQTTGFALDVEYTARISPEFMMQRIG